MPTKQDYIDAINEKLDERLSSSAESEENQEKAAVTTSGNQGAAQCTN